MDVERQLTRQGIAVLFNAAVSLTDGVKEQELKIDEEVHRILAKNPHRMRPEVCKEKNKLTFSMTSLEEICFKVGCLSANECVLITRLIRRIRDLLILHYDAMHEFPVESLEDFQYCAPQDYAHLAARLNIVGNFLRLHPTRLLSILNRTGEEMTDILFKETIGLSASHEDSARELEMRQSSRNTFVELPSTAQMVAMVHRASCKYLNLVGHLWICVAQKSANPIHRQLAWKRIVECSSRNIEMPVIGTARTHIVAAASLRPCLQDFLINDGIQVLVFSWTDKYKPGAENPHATILEQIDTDVWRRQSKESILWIMNILLTKLERYSSPDGHDAIRVLSKEPEEFTSTPLFQHILFTIYTIFGLEPFQYAAPKARVSALFQALACRLGRHPGRYRDRDRFGQLVFKCVRLDTGTLSRYLWLSLDYTTRMGFLENCSCANARCSYKQHFQERFNGKTELNNEEEGELDEWGMKMKVCAGCRMVMYCCKACQREGWHWHKAYCLEGREYQLTHEPEQEKLSP